MDADLRRALDKLLESECRLEISMQGLKERTMKREFSPEVILAYRKAEEHGEFKRAIVKQTPVTINDDELELECGHKVTFMLSLLQALDRRTLDCRECQREWLDKASKTGDGK